MEIVEKAQELRMPTGPCQTTQELVNCPQLKARGFFLPEAHPELTSASFVEPGQSITYPGFPVKMSDLPYRVQRRAPLIGEHNEEIYIEELGFSREELARLKASKVI